MMTLRDGEDVPKALLYTTLHVLCAFIMQEAATSHATVHTGRSSSGTSKLRTILHV